MADPAQTAISAIAGLVCGAIGSLLSPWVRWGIEKRKARLAARREFIASARQAVTASEDMSEFRETAVYSRLRPHLAPKTREFIESNAIHIDIGARGGGVNNFKTRVFDDLHALEQKWGLL